MGYKEEEKEENSQNLAEPRLEILKPKERQKIYGFIQDKWIRKQNEFGML